ncbi:HNH endonuclease [Kribbella sp. NBC_00709]|uniref:HNH endonuclease signature motif containing protein n=1 Tax=Kribbella sp. NBC_00709 TaxID=2975972 RepID=UPI002E2DB69E|nr:DUF222 domain-containing protein [Kribbella sp. NBC_00709]
MEILGERPVWSMSDSEKLSALDAVVAEKARLETLELQLIAGIDASGYATELGAGSTARLLTKRYRIDSAGAHRNVRLATRLTKYAATSAALPDPAVPFASPSAATNPDTGDAAPEPPGTPDAADLTAGSDTGDHTAGPAAGDDAAGADGAGAATWRVHPGQAAAIVAILDKLPATVPAENLEFAERRLIDLAATHTPTELRKAGRSIRDILDPDGPEPDEKAAYTRESLTWKTADRGVTFRGYLANENAELFRTLIHAYARPHRTIDGQLDPRPASKRQADALTTILNTTGTANDTATATHTGPADADAATDSATGRGEGGTLVQLPLPPTGTGCTEPDRDAEGRDADGRDADRSGGDRQFVPGHGPKPHISITIDYNDLIAATANATGDMIFGDNLSAATVRRLACDAQILPIVLGTRSQPLDVGTTQRLVTRPMRRALNARDKGCVICNAPPIQCEAHHIISWLDGGITAISNLALLCKRHHHDLHSGHWRIRILDGVVLVTHPTWANPTAIPPDRYKPPTGDITHQPIAPRPNPWADEEHPPDPTSPRPSTPTDTPPPAPLDPWTDNANAS